MNKCIRQEIFEHFRAANPYPTTELNFNSPSKLSTAVLLSVQITDVDMNKATIEPFPMAATPQVMLDLGLDDVMECTKTIRLYKAKSKHIMQTCRILLEKYYGEVPADRSMLKALPGVGCKTTNMMLDVAFRQPVMTVDTHIFRVSNRTKVAPGKDMYEVEDKLMCLVPKEFPVDAHHWFIPRDRYTCEALKPQCKTCIINDLCEYPVRLMQSGERGRLKPGRFAASDGIGVCSGEF